MHAGFIMKIINKAHSHSLCYNNIGIEIVFTQLLGVIPSIK